MKRFFPRRPDNLFIMRGRGGVVAFYAFIAVALYLLGDSAVRGAWDVVFSALPWVLLVLWVLYVAAFQPYIGYSDRAVVVYNVFKRYEFPWSAVRTITDHQQFVFTLKTGAPIKAWGGPNAKRPRGSQAASGTGAAARTPLEHLTHVWHEGRVRSQGDSALVTWNIPAIAVGVVLILWSVLSLI
ncbi:hypothetical protein D9V34_00940 [Mycetocola lacteus]|uniref:PH domain-containing protein n=1 Tax=Mycetocola lacteus TaxID=76637 RepID=A0A3L7AW65_9MICO|nr:MULTISPECIES: hypothetical protein [Mycetocola]MCS4275495.1 hypothetical protein [Mycetocola sp. BIGb0189]RLP80811.1 hypothetical protein D9V34_13235 [Mycetocola lacteus]RLP84596.1 hypothetical protein D9V34_00940 [Mycetocola lacteus]